MHISLPLTTLLATAGAVAVPAPHRRPPQPFHGLHSEHIAIDSYWVRKTNSTIQSVSFQISSKSNNVTCSTGAIPVLPSAIVPCAGQVPDSGFRFSLSHLGGNSTAHGPMDPNQYDLTVYHGSGAAGKWGKGSVPTYCHAGGINSQDLVCSQIPALGPYGLTLRG